eukprot:1153748-Pelagomonas_calceolata.AAC.2
MKNNGRSCHLRQHSWKFQTVRWPRVMDREEGRLDAVTDAQGRTGLGRDGCWQPGKPWQEDEGQEQEELGEAGI